MRQPVSQTQRHTSAAPPRSRSILQRTCAGCGQHTIAGAACGKCQQAHTVHQPPALDGESRFGYDLSPVPFQAKLTIGQPNDKYEQEADRIADQVMRMPEPQVQRQAELEEEDTKEDLVQANLSNEVLPLAQRQMEGAEELQMKAELSELQRQEIEEDDELRQRKLPTSEMPAQLQDDASLAGNRTGMPSRLKNGLEALSGLDLSGVRVHHNSSKPAQLNALAYTQGQDIYISPGQERHLPHEGWHAVQQMQGRVTATMQAKDVSINDDAGLEREADVMGRKARQFMYGSPNSSTADDQAMKMKRESQHSMLDSAVVQRSVDPQLDVLIVGHASPRWEHTHGRAREELNLNLSQDRVREVETYFREIFNRKYGSRGIADYGFERMSLDVEVADEMDSLTSHGVGSSQTTREAGGDVRANDPSMRRVDLTTSVRLHVSGHAPSSVAVEETTIEDTHSRHWAVQIAMVGSFGEVGGGGFALGNFKNRKTGQIAPGLFIGGGLAGGPEIPVPSASPSPSWSDFTTVRPMTFEDFNGEAARLTDLSFGIGIAGYSAAFFQIEGMSESVYVGGFVMNEWGLGGAVLGGDWTFTSIPEPRVITSSSSETERTPYEFSIPDEFEHSVYFDTGSAEIDDANMTQLEVYVDTVIGNIQAHEAKHADE